MFGLDDLMDAGSQLYENMEEEKLMRKMERPPLPRSGGVDGLSPGNRCSATAAFGGGGLDAARCNLFGVRYSDPAPFENVWGYLR